ncbi:MAG: phosphorylase [Rhodocyclaceae bacterium]|nr:phosphorylase [Rhodocyclaceae bacterium]
MNDVVDDATSARNPGSVDIIALAARRRKQALASGALQPIRTTRTWIEQDGLRFPVKWIDSLVRKHHAGQTPTDPFAAPEPDLLVCSAGARHWILLNKFPVLDHHLLVVSRGFVEQSQPLEPHDFAAILPLVRDHGGLAFYNGDRIAGASQRHRHLQWIPRDDEAALPLLAGLEASADAGHGRCTQWPYHHWIAPLPPSTWTAADASSALHDRYAEGCRALYLSGADAGAYNLLITRTAMLLVRRARESAEGISINALGFAGSFFVGRAERLDTVQRLTPFGILRAVGCPWPSGGLGDGRPG